MSDFTSASSFKELEIGDEFSYLEERWIKINNARAKKVDSDFTWLFPSDTIVDIDISDEFFDSDEGEN